MNDESHRFTAAATPQGPARDLSDTADVWRDFMIDMPLSLGCLPPRVATDMLQFASKRLHAHADHLGELTHCRSLIDFAQVQTAFLTRAMLDYQKEAVTLLGDARQAVTADHAPV